MLLIAGQLQQLQCAHLNTLMPTKLREGKDTGPTHWQHDVQGLNKNSSKTDIIIAISVRRHIYLKHNVVNCWTTSSTAMSTFEYDNANQVARGEGQWAGPLAARCARLNKINVTSAICN